MRSQVNVIVAPGEEFAFDLDKTQAMPASQARQWLDEQYAALDCEPLRASGKLLTADKVLVVAQAGGSRLLSDPAWGQAFARATSAALGKPVVHIDLPAMSLAY